MEVLGSAEVSGRPWRLEESRGCRWFSGLARTHYDIEVEHFLLKLLDTTDSDFPRILKQFGVDKSRLTGDLTRSLDKLKSGNA